MSERNPTVVLLAAAILLAGTVALAAGRGPAPKGEAVSTHAPYAMGECGKCHVRSNPADPGPAPPFDEGCLECHEDFKEPVQLENGPHPTGGGKACVDCHNPHSARKRKLLM